MDRVAGDNRPAVQALHGNGIDVVGYVDDPYDWLTRARLHVHPIRFGAGIKNKLLDTIGAGLPFITTTSGAEGMQLGELTPLLVADEPEAFVERVVDLYTDEARWARVQSDLLALARERLTE